VHEEKMKKSKVEWYIDKSRFKLLIETQLKGKHHANNTNRTFGPLRLDEALGPGGEGRRR